MRSLRVKSLYVQARTPEDALKVIERRSESFGRSVTNAAKVVFFAAFVGSVVLTSTGFSLNLRQPWPGVGVVLTVLTIGPAILQTLDWLWPDRPIKPYRQSLQWLNMRLARYVRRRMTAWAFARYGSQEIAQRLPPEGEAKGFTVVAHLRRRRRWIIATLSVGILATVGSITGVVFVRQPMHNYHLDQQILLDSGFGATVLMDPVCAPGGTGEVYCSVNVRFRNIGHSPNMLGPGSFTPAGQNEIDEAGCYCYAVELIDNANNYDFSRASWSETSSEIQPGQAVVFDLSFSVSAGIHPGELLLKSEVSGMMAYVSFP